MTDYPLERLLKVRRLRENKAEQEVARRTRELTEANSALEECKRELAEYTQWRLKEEEALFLKIKKQLVSMQDIERYKQNLLSLRGEEVKFEEHVLDAEQHLADCTAALDAAREARLTAARERMKIEEHGRRWDGEQRLQAERAEEFQLEEHTNTRQGNGFSPVTE